MQENHAALLDAIDEKGVLDDEMVEELRGAISKALDDYLIANEAR